MGSPEHEHERYDDEGPQHSVAVQPFFMGQTPITQAQWRAVASMPQIEIELKPNPAEFKGDDRPVENVSWNEAIEFCKRLSEHTGRIYRLPTEAEWEYACRADTTTPFYFGETITTDLVNYKGSVYQHELKDKGRGETTSVGTFPPNAFGLYDMHGNVLEWCLDQWHSNYVDAPTDGSARQGAKNRKNRVRRGGSWESGAAQCRSAYRLNYIRGTQYTCIGLRIVCEELS